MRQGDLKMNKRTTISTYLSTTGNSMQIQTAKNPTGSLDASGYVGDMAWDDNYVYVKTSTGWKRTALTAW